MAYIAIIEDEAPLLQSVTLAFPTAGHCVDAYDQPLIALSKVILVPPHLLVLNADRRQPLTPTGTAPQPRCP